MGLLSMLKNVLGAESVTQPTQQTRSSAKSTTRPARTPQSKQSKQSKQRTQQTQHVQQPSRAFQQSQRTTQQRTQQSQSKPAKLTPQPLLPAERIDKARATIGKIEKHDLSDHHRRLYRMAARHKTRHFRRNPRAVVH